MKDKYRLGRRQRLEILREARRRLARPRGWTKGSYRRDHAASDGGASFCLVGAVNHTARDLFPAKFGGENHLSEASNDLVRLLSVEGAVQRKGFSSVPNFNDAGKTRKAEVLAVLDEKIEELSNP